MKPLKLTVTCSGNTSIYIYIGIAELQLQNYSCKTRTCFYCMYYLPSNYSYKIKVSLHDDIQTIKQTAHKSN